MEINPDGSGEIVYANGLRNPQGMGYARGTNTLWVAVNERDELGDNLVPDYITSVKKEGFTAGHILIGDSMKTQEQKNIERPNLVKKAIIPYVSMDAHTAS